MTCLVYEGTGLCVWCRGERDEHPYRWCRRCHGDMSTPDPTDRESQLKARPGWAWRQHPCACRHGIVTMEGRKLSHEDEKTLSEARRPVEHSKPRVYLPFDEPDNRPTRTVAET